MVRRVAASAWPTRLAVATFLVAAVISGYRDVQPLSPVQSRFIGHADRANMALLARNIAQGRGAVVDTVWLLRDGGLPGNEVTVPEPYWSVYAATWVAFFFLVLGASQQSMVLAGVVAKVLVAGLAGVWTHKLTRQRLTSLAVALVLLFSARMSATVDGVSDLYVTLAILVAGTVLCWALVRGGRLPFLASGAFCGLAIGIKPTGLVLFGAIVGLGLLLRKRHRWLQASLLLSLGVAIGVAPLAWHNYRAFGHLVSPANAIVAKAAAILWLTGNHDLAFYGPEQYEFSQSERHALRYEKPRDLLVGFLRHVAAGKVAFKPLLVPVLLGPFLLLFGWLQRAAFSSAPDRMFAVFVLTMLGGGLLLSAFVHYEARYWNFLVPLSTVLGIWVLRQIWPPLALLMSVYLSVTTLGSLGEPKRPRHVPPAYRRIERFVPQTAVILTRDPWEVAFHTHRRTVALPCTPNEDVLLSVARRYSAEYLVIHRGRAPHPIYEPITRGDFPEWLELVHYDRNLAIGRLRQGGPTHAGSSYGQPGSVEGGSEALDSGRDSGENPQMPWVAVDPKSRRAPVPVIAG